MPNLDGLALFEGEVQGDDGLVGLLLQLGLHPDALERTGRRSLTVTTEQEYLEVVMECSVDIEGIGSVREAQAKVRRLPSLGHFDNKVPV